MNNPKYQSIIKAAAESKDVDFKGPMDWRTGAYCDKLEILKDVAAMANAGGGVIVIGRDAPSHTTGTLSSAQAKSFDATEVNKFVHAYLDPQIECRVEMEQSSADVLAVIDVPEFESTPLVFKTIGNCSEATCKKRPHFRPGDVYIRTKAAQSKRISDAAEMQELIRLGIRNSSQYFVTEIQRMLSAPLSVEQPLPASPYDEILEREGRDFFKPRLLGGIPNTVGLFDMTVMPAEFRSDRLELKRLPRDIREFAYVIQRSGILKSVPYDENTTSENFSNGCRLYLLNLGWRHVEAVSLHRSGLYRIMRVFVEDYDPNADRTTAVLVQNERQLWIDTFVEQMTMFHLLARNIARQLLTDLDDEVQIDLRVSGLVGRTLAASNCYDVDHFLHLFGTHSGTENTFLFPLRITLRELEIQAVNLARDRCEQILWTFGIMNPVAFGFQRKLLGNTEPVAFPPV